MCDLCQRDYESVWEKKSRDNVVLGFHIKIWIRNFDFRDYMIIVFVVCMLAHQKKKTKN